MPPKLAKILMRLFSFSAPLASTLLAMTGVGFYITFISLHFTELGYNEVILGIIQGSYFLGLFLGAWKIDYFVKRIGPIQVLAISGTLLAITSLLQAFSNDLTLWIITRIFAGLALAAFYVVIECWMIDHSGDQERGVVLSLYMIVLNAGYIIGQQIIGHISLHNSSGFIIAALLACLSVIPIAFSINKLTPPEHEAPLKFRKIFKASPLGTIGCLITGLAISALYSFLAIIAKHFTVDGPQLVSIFVLGGLLAQWPIGRLSDHFDRRKILILISATLLLASLLLLLPPIHTYLTYTLVGCLGIAVFTLYPISLNLTTDRLHRKHFIRAMASLLLLYGAASSIGPLLAALCIQWIDTTGFFSYLSLLGALITIIALYSLKRPPVPEEDHEEFSPSPHTTPSAYNLKPSPEEDR